MDWRLYWLTRMACLWRQSHVETARSVRSSRTMRRYLRICRTRLRTEVRLRSVARRSLPIQILSVSMPRFRILTANIKTRETYAPAVCGSSIIRSQPSGMCISLRLICLIPEMRKSMQRWIQSLISWLHLVLRLWNTSMSQRQRCRRWSHILQRKSRRTISHLMDSCFRLMMWNMVKVLDGQRNSRGIRSHLNGQTRKRRQRFGILSGVRPVPGWSIRWQSLMRYRSKERLWAVPVSTMWALWSSYSLESVIRSRCIRRIWSSRRSVRTWRNPVHSRFRILVRRVAVRQRSARTIRHRRLYVRIRHARQRQSSYSHILYHETRWTSMVYLRQRFRSS